MKISIKWLNDYVDVNVPIETLSQRLTMAGLEVEKIEKVGGDTVFELEITPNRPDCLNMLGLARETSAILNVSFNPPKINPVAYPKKKCDITIDDNEGCLGYIGALVENVNIGKTPKDMLARLNALGLRSINNIVDITNFVLLETGQPLHAFDYDKLAGGKIVVRRASKGEKIVTIDDVERELDPSILVIADAERPVAIAGVMGGKETEVTASTKNILLESAYFDPILIRRASRKLGLSTDSSYRFERGVDKEMVDTGSVRALGLILELAQGAVLARSMTGALKTKKSLKKILISLDEINHHIGAKLNTAKCRTILKKLGFSVQSDDRNHFKIQPPPFREDIKGKPDIVEEIIRIIGYDNLPLTVPSIIMSNISVDPRRGKRDKIARNLCSQGLNEVITYTMINQAELDRARQHHLAGQKIQNPLTQDYEMMRPTLLPSLLSILRNNINKGQKNVQFFELGKIYLPKKEQETLGILLSGIKSIDWRDEKPQVIDYYDLKGIIENMFLDYHLDLKEVSFEISDEEYFCVGQRANIILKNKRIGVLGQIDEDILTDFGIKRTQAFFAQIDLETVYRYKTECVHFIPLPEYPSVQRDISLAVKKDLSAGKIMRTLREWGKTLDGMEIVSMRFIEKYEGEKIANDCRGYVFSLQYQSKKQTLRDDDVSCAHKKLCEKLVEHLSVIIR